MLLSSLILLTASVNTRDHQQKILPPTRFYTIHPPTSALLLSQLSALTINCGDTRVKHSSGWKDEPFSDKKKTEDRLSRSPVYQVEKSFASVDRLSGRIWSLPCSHLFPSTQPPFVSFCTSRLFCVALWNCTTSTPTVPHMCTVAAIPQHVYCTNNINSMSPICKQLECGWYGCWF